MKSLPICGLIFLAFVVGLFAGRSAPGARREPTAPRQLPAEAVPTEIRLSVPAEANGTQRKVKKLRVRSSDTERPENLWVVYLVVDGKAYGHVCEATQESE
ncbi:hypothetical protein [Frigoriglobus tundricola]|uniref:hypothetical protein n=1 Tax=Frigoriglobus tundricola TaxID=2774151 RepID=UPI00148EE06A|nr:hypothetical protein [Frigoriglobus tundricola]